MKVPPWIEFGSGLILAVIAGTAFVFSTFQTKSEASQSMSHVEKTLDEMNDRMKLIESYILKSK